METKDVERIEDVLEKHTSRVLFGDRVKRVEKVNELLKFIGDCGRHFFREDSDRPVAKEYYRYCYFEIDSNYRLWFFTAPRMVTAKQHRIYMHGQYAELNVGNKSGHGGTLTRLVMALKEFIMTGKSIPAHFGPFPSWACEGDPWGYGEDMEKVRSKAIELGIYKP